MKLVPSAPEKVDILIVDDDPRNLDALSLVLEREDFNLVVARSGAQALSEICPTGGPRREFAVVLLDVMMPEMDGFECAKAIRKCSGCDTTPIIFVTAIANDMDFVFKGYSAGAIDYIVKPIAPTIVKAKVSVFVELFIAKRLLKVELAESQALCRKLEQTNADGRFNQEEIAADLRTYNSAFEARMAAKSLNHPFKNKF